MSVERFLIFWSHNNTLIIEILIGLILLTVIYLAFRSFFGPEPEEEATAGAPRSALDSAQLEKTLQKILESGAGAAAAASASAEAAPPAGAEGAAAAGGDPAVTQQLKTEVAEKTRQLEELKAQLAAQAQAASQGLSLDDQKKLDEKLKDLEARLAEYEIISEDIADLSFYKEENARLQKEVESAGKAAPAAAPEPVVEPAPEPVVEAAPEPVPEPVTVAAEPVAEVAPAPEAPPATPEPEAVTVTEPAAEAAPVPALDPDAEAALQAMAEAAAAPAAPVGEAATEAPAEGAITPPVPADQVASSDEALKEMAEAAAKKTPADEIPPGEASQLMNQFENFVKKG
ncbi:MAG: hypothetical protein KF802_05020 [Bdellovibrionaceae bacterium]|nr:hypothetical protein [Pseudobdellovibrionaceae bacterium]